MASNTNITIVLPFVFWDAGEISVDSTDITVDDTTITVDET